MRWNHVYESKRELCDLEIEKAEFYVATLPELHAPVCEMCGALVNSYETSLKARLSVLREEDNCWTSGTSVDAIVCSFRCAERFTEGRWAILKRRPFPDFHKKAHVEKKKVRVSEVCFVPKRVVPHEELTERHKNKRISLARVRKALLDYNRVEQLVRGVEEDDDDNNA